MRRKRPLRGRHAAILCRYCKKQCAASWFLDAKKKKQYHKHGSAWCNTCDRSTWYGFEEDLTIKYYKNWKSVPWSGIVEAEDARFLADINKAIAQVRGKSLKDIW